MTTPYDLASEIRPLTAAGWMPASVIAQAEAGLAQATFIPRLPDIGRRARFVQQMSGRRCDNCGHSVGYLASPPRRQLDRISGTDERGTIHYRDACMT